VRHKAVRAYARLLGSKIILMSRLQSLGAGEVSPVAYTTCSRKSAPPISDRAMIRSRFEWTGMALPSIQCDDSCHDLEHGAAMWGITTNPEPKRAIMGDKRSNGESETGMGNMPVGLKYPPAVLAPSRFYPVGFATQPRGPFVDLKTHGFERIFNYAYPEQEPMAGPHLLGRRSTALSSMYRNFGSSWATEKTLETFQSIDSPYAVNFCGPFGRVCFSPASGPLFHLRLRMNLCAPGDVDDSSHHPSTSPPPSPAVDHRLERVILQSTPFELETVRLTPVGGCIPDTTARGLRGRSSPNLTIGDSADSIGTECSYLGLWKRRADVVRGYFTLQHRIATLVCGEVRPFVESHLRWEGSLKRLVGFKVLIR